jgi:aspartyl-tRNA(Asn)/glutamyl-tRNA(Gln) amidotransferase subunit A
LAVGDYIENSDREVLEAVTEAAKIFEKLGARVEKVEMSLLREAALANGVITQADGAAFHRERLAEHPDWFGADVRQRLEIGRNFTSTEYSLARRTQVEMKHRLGKLFERYDFLLLPTTPIPAPLIEGGDAIEQARRLTRFTAPFNLTGLPAVSLPCGLSREGLPIGLQVVALWWAEAELLRAGQAFTRATKWNERRPALSQA